MIQDKQEALNRDRNTNDNWESDHGGFGKDITLRYKSMISEKY